MHEQDLELWEALTCQPEATSRADKQQCIQSFRALANLIAGELMFSLQTGQCSTNRVFIKTIRHTAQDAGSPDAGNTAFDVKIRHFAGDIARGMTFSGYVPYACELCLKPVRCEPNPK